MAYPYEEEDRRAALTQGLLAAGLAALGARKGSEYNAFAQAGLLGLGGYNTSLRDATDAREAQALRKMREEQYAMQKAQWEQAQAEKLKMQQAAAGGRRPSNDVIVADARRHTYDEIAEKYGISRNIVAGVMHRHRSKRTRSAPARVREFA